MYFPALDNLIRMFSSLPGIGPRSAIRIAFHILRADPEQAEELARSIRTAREEILFCESCGGLTDESVCSLCTDERRDDELICVVEEPNDIYAIEKTGEFSGKYHVLNGALSPLDGIGPGDLRIQELLGRVERKRPREILIATNPTLEGDATAQYLADLLKNRDILITRISHGIPTGGQLEYAESTALARSIQGRR